MKWKHCQGISLP